MKWRTNFWLFVATVLSVFLAGMAIVPPLEPVGSTAAFVRQFLRGGWFAVPLLAILVTHEFGHFIAAKIHRVEASLPYFIPLPFLSPFGTMGAVIAMRGRIRSRNALLDIGASGPIAGMVVALPVLALGLSKSPVNPIEASGYEQEGQSLLYLAMKRAFVGSIPDGYDVFLHPIAFAGWAGLLVTMINLLPWGQLDGGHVAYALLGPKQNRVARWVRAALLPLFLYNLASFVIPVATHRSRMPYGQAVSNSLFWLMWFIVLSLIGRMSGGTEHPPVEPGDLSPGRRVVAVASLVLFVLLFMPTPMAVY